MRTVVIDFIVAVYCGIIVAANPTYVGLGAGMLLSSIVAVRRIREYLARRADAKYEAD